VRPSKVAAEYQNASQFEEIKKEDDEEEEVPHKRYRRSVISVEELKKSQLKLRSYPSVLLHTLFHENDRYEKYRNHEFSNLFFFGDEVKSMGNEAYHKGDYYTALDYYEQCLTLYNWLELRDPTTKERLKITLYAHM
jgi:hypothetical protein